MLALKRPHILRLIGRSWGRNKTSRLFDSSGSGAAAAAAAQQQPINQTISPSTKERKKKKGVLRELARPVNEYDTHTRGAYCIYLRVHN